MGFITHCCKSVLQSWAAKVHAWFGLGVLCALLSFNVGAQTPALELAELYVDRLDSSVVLSANLKLELGASVEEALLKGVAVHFVAEAVVLRDRWYWTDKRMASVARFYRLAYQPLTRRWRLTLSADSTAANGGAGNLSQQFESLTEALVAIQSAGGAAKQAREMSKGTKFQLYLALRAAAYEQVAAGGTVLPFFCDDIFETFDEGRTTAACGLLSQIGQRGQAIYLTHHKHVVDIARALCGDAVQVHQVTG